MGDDDSYSLIEMQVVEQQVNGVAERLEQEFIDLLHCKPNDIDRIKSVAFVFLVAKYVLNLTEDEALEGIVEGSSDFGIDAIYYTSEDDEVNITFLQGKYKNKPNTNFPQNGVLKAIHALNTLFDPNDKDIGNRVNQKLKYKVEEIHSFLGEGKIPNIRAIMCSKGKGWTEQAQDDIDDKKFENYVQWEHVGPAELMAIRRSVKPADVKLQLVGKAIVEDLNRFRILIGRTSALSLAAIMGKHGELLLEKNIRRFLGQSRVNKDIEATLKNDKNRDNFYFYNNGLTILCSNFTHNAFQEENKLVNIKDFQIVNGGQTARAIRNVFKDMGEEKMRKAEVLVRIYALPEEDDDLLNQITLATNSQNPIDLRDLKSNNDEQKDLEESIKHLKDSNGENFSYRRKREAEHLPPNELTNAVVAEAVLAVWRECPHQARFMSKRHFGSLYEVIFGDLNGSQAVIAALVFRFCENARKRYDEKSPTFLPYGSRFVAMQMGYYLLTDMQMSLDKLHELTHKNFDAVLAKFEEKKQIYFGDSSNDVAKALNKFLMRNYQDPEISLQRLSATFRRSDLIDIMKEARGK